MMCDLCKKSEAKVHLTQMIDGKTKKVDLCEACSKEKGVDDPTGFSLADFLLGLGAAQEMEQAGGEAQCPRCGFTQADFKKSGRLGCAECYGTFAEGLEGLLKTMHKGTRHTGKVPQTLQRIQETGEKLRTLQKRLDKAVSEENFELAATLRDEIKRAKEDFAGLTTT
jgi:protein arginine kinase activator